MISADKRRLDYIDSLRGIAALSVVIYHILNYLYLNSASVSNGTVKMLSYLVLNSLNLGLFGVVFFFLISGFIIPYSLHQKTNIKKFSIGRIFRLYPAFWISIILTVLIGPYVGTAEFTVNQILANATMVPKVFHENLINGIYWTLFIELLFYIVCASLFTLQKLDNVFVIGVLALLFNCITPTSILINHFTTVSLPIQFIGFHLSFLFLGSLLRLAIQQREKMAKVFIGIFLLINCISLPLINGLYFQLPDDIAGKLSEYNPYATISAYLLAMVAFYLAVVFMKPISIVWGGIGRISYSLYLIHWLCCLIVLKFSPINSFGSQLAFIIFGTFLSILVSHLIYKFIESPAITLGKTIAKNC